MEEQLVLVSYEHAKIIDYRNFMFYILVFENIIECIFIIFILQLLPDLPHLPTYPFVFSLCISLDSCLLLTFKHWEKLFLFFRIFQYSSMDYKSE